MQETIRLNTGNTIPRIGYGTWKIEDGEHAIHAVGHALETGYRLIDTAARYENESGVGEAIKQSAVPREELFVTTKLWKDDLGYERAFAALDESLEKLGLDYVDLYLIHWPTGEERHAAWRALTEIFESGRAKNIGVSNYDIQELEQIFDMSDTVPAVNQIELHPFNYHTQKELLDFCAQKGIVIEAYSPLAHGAYMDDPTISRIAQSIDKTTAQVMLRWCMQHGAVPIPKSENPDRIRNNFDVFNFELTDEQMGQINKISE
jgi:diketogulonate reductase-like aldo/keto reductase